MSYPHGCDSGGQAATVAHQDCREHVCSAEMQEHPYSLLFSKCWDYGTHCTWASEYGLWMAGSKLSAGLHRQLRDNRRQRPALQWEILAVRSSQARPGNTLPNKAETSCLPSTLNAEVLDPWAKKLSSDIWLPSRVQEIRISINSLWGIQGVMPFCYQVLLLLKTAQNYSSCLVLSCLF